MNFPKALITDLHLRDITPILLPEQEKSQKEVSSK